MQINIPLFLWKDDSARTHTLRCMRTSKENVFEFQILNHVINHPIHIIWRNNWKHYLGKWQAIKIESIWTSKYSRTIVEYFLSSPYCFPGQSYFQWRVRIEISKQFGLGQDSSLMVIIPNSFRLRINDLNLSNHCNLLLMINNILGQLKLSRQLKDRLYHGVSIVVIKSLVITELC